MPAAGEDRLAAVGGRAAQDGGLIGGAADQEPAIAVEGVVVALDDLAGAEVARGDVEGQAVGRNQRGRATGHRDSGAPRRTRRYSQRSGPRRACRRR